jgi:hypothetical protein
MVVADMILEYYMGCLHFIFPERVTGGGVATAYSVLARAHEALMPLHVIVYDAFSCPGATSTGE